MQQRKFSKAFARIRGGCEYPQLCGTVSFFQRNDGVIVEVEMYGLPETETYFFAFHIHGGGSCGCIDFSDAGSHFNPGTTIHP